MQIVSIAWNVKSCFLGNKTNNNFFFFFFIYFIFFFLFIYLFIFFLSSVELAQIVVIRYLRVPSVVSLSKTLYPRILVLLSTQEYAA